MPQLQFFGPTGRDSDNRAANSARLVNCYLEPVQPGGRTGYTIKGVLGMTAQASLPGVFMRSMAEVGGTLYAVCNGSLFSIASDGAVTTLGAVDDSANATITGNFGDVAVTVDNRYFIWDGVSVTEPATGAFSAMGAAEYIGGYTVITEADGRRFQWSGLADASSLPGLNFSTADGRDDNAIRPFQIGGQLYILKERSFEVWYPTGLAGASAFQRQVGGVVDIGLKAFGLVCRVDQGAFMVADDNRAYLIGSGLIPVSNPMVETAIDQLSPVFCFSYSDEGHTFCVIVFADGPAWVFDTATREWHERAEGVDFDPWSVRAAARAYGRDYVGKDGGDILSLARTSTDNGAPLPRVMVSRTLANDGDRFVIDELEIFPRQGFAAATVALRLSRDNGITWGAPRVQSWGVGEYARRIIWRSLGQFRQATAEITITDAEDISVNAEGRLALR
jgi:hypothetical protein